jgi:hypothetical protein
MYDGSAVGDDVLSLLLSPPLESSRLGGCSDSDGVGRH